MNRYIKNALLTAIGATTVALLFRKLTKKFLPQIPLDTYTKTCLSFAVIDDEICRNELEGYTVEGTKIEFPTKSQSIHYRYQLFLDMYKGSTLEKLKEEKSRLLERLEESKRYKIK